MRRVLLSFTLLVLAAPTRSQENEPGSWPCWRGPERDGVSREGDWDPIGRAEPLWRAELGLGYSNVALAGGRLYTLGHDPEPKSDRVFCLDARTGAELWRFAYHAETMANFHGGGTLTTPALDGGRVFTSGREGLAHCLDAATGALVWERNYAKELGLAVPQYGFAGSPVILGERMFLALGGTLIAADKATGDVIWKTKDRGDGAYATPTPFALGERPCLAAFLGKELVIVDRESGKELYTYLWKGEAGAVNAASPIVAGRRVFVSSAYDAGAALLELGEAPEPALVWYTRALRNKVSGCTLFEGNVYGFDESILKCIALEDGKERWRERGLGMGAVAVAGGRLIVLDSSGELVIAEANPAGFRELSRKKVLDGGVYWTTPVLAGGLIYCRNSLGQLACLDHRPQDGGKPAAAAGPYVRLAVPPGASLFAAHALRSGAEALRERSSLRLTGWYESPGAGITRTPMTIDWMAPDRWHMTIELGTFGKIERCYDGKIGWVLDPFFGNKLLEGEPLAELADASRFYGPLEWRECYKEMKTSGLESFGGNDCWAVEATTPQGTVRTLYFDSKTDLLAGREAENESLVRIEEWRDFGGVHLPAKTVATRADTGEEELVELESAEWDSVDPAAFARPPEVLRMLRTPEEIAADEAALREHYARYLGRFVTDVGPSAGQTHVVDVKDGSLVVDVPGMRAFPLAEPDAAGRFYFPPTEIYVTFELDENGRARAMIMHDAPGAPPEMTYARIEDE